MRIASFGDLHLGHTPALDKFQVREEHLLRFDDHLFRTHDRIILMGDIYQTDYGVLPGSRSDVLEQILKRYARIARRWKAPHFQILFGNHDRIIQKHWGALKQIRVRKDGWRLWLIHGHQFDPFIGEKGKLPYYVTWMIGGLRRTGMKKLADFLEGPFYDFGQGLCARLEKAAHTALWQGRNQVIVMGHSHRMKYQVYERGVYLNSGAPTPSFLPYASIDTERRRVELRAFLPPRTSVNLFCWQDPSISPGPF